MKCEKEENNGKKEVGNIQRSGATSRMLKKMPGKE